MSLARVLVCIGTCIFTVIAWGQSPGVHLGDLSWPEAERRYADRGYSVWCRCQKAWTAPADER